MPEPKTYFSRNKTLASRRSTSCCRDRVLLSKNIISARRGRVGQGVWRVRGVVDVYLVEVNGM